MRPTRYRSARIRTYSQRNIRTHSRTTSSDARKKEATELVRLAKRGEITKAKVDECYKSWKANASKGDSYKLIQRMDKYYNDLWREETDDN